MQGKYGKYYLSGQFFPQKLSQLPADWDDVFGRSAPLQVEIGFGAGEYLINSAAEYPECNFLGIELSRESVVRLLRQANTCGLQNIRAVQQDARLILRECCADNTIDHVTMNFPDPWPKVKHRHRRLINSDFTNILAAVLKPDKSYELVTDQKWYAEDAVRMFKDSTCFEVSEVEINPERQVTTRYEQKWREIGRDSYRVTARKVKHINIKRQLEHQEMPHVFIDRNLGQEELTALEGHALYLDGKRMIIKSSYRGLQHQTFLVRVVSKDQDFKQDFFVLVKKAGRGRWLAKLDPVTNPYRTPAVKMAVAEIGRLLNNQEAVDGGNQ